jgi:hypothetical protein
MFDTVDNKESWGLNIPNGPYPKCGKTRWKDEPKERPPCEGTLLPRTEPTPYSQNGVDYIDIKHPTLFWRCNKCGERT